MASLNKVMLIGNAGKDAELRYTASGAARAEVPLAVNGRRKNGAGEWEEQTEWFNVVLFGETAERVSQYITKGKPVFIEGRVQTRTWDDDKGQKHYRTEVLANTVQLLGSREDGAPGFKKQEPQEAGDLPFA
jgi:single-strand DNA-binding protein